MEIFNFLIEIPQRVAECFSFLTTPIEFIGLSPLTFFGIGGVVAIVSIHITRLFLG